MTKYVLSFLFVFAALAVHAEVAPEAAAAPSDVDAAPSATVDNAGTETTYLICKNKSDVRTVRVHKRSNGGCETTYTKDGVDKSVGNSWAVNRCTKVLGNIRTNLEKANWKCKDISEARVSSSEE